MNQCLTLFFVYIFLEGVLRKWILPGVPGSLLYGIKYLLLLTIIGIYLSKNKSESQPIVTPASRAYKIYAFIVILSALTITGATNSLPAGIITIVQYTSPIILISVIPLWLDSPRKIKRFLICGCFISFIALILAVVQYSSPPTAYINKYAMDLKTDIATVGGAARVCSVFSYLTPFGDLCLVILSFSAMLLSLRWGKVTKWVLIALLSLTLLGCLMTGSRSVVLLGCVYLVCIALYQGFYKQRWHLIYIIALVAVGGYFYYNAYGIEAIDNFISRVNHASHDVDTRITRQFDITRMFDYSGVFGNGAGIANISTQPFLVHKSEVDWEEEIGRVMIEFGFVGFLIVTGIRIFVWCYMVRLSRFIKDSYLSVISWASILVITPMTFYAQLCLYNWFAYIVYFTMIGLNIAVAQMDMRRKYSANRP